MLVRVTLAVGLILGASAAARADCRVLDGEIRKAVGAGDVDRFADLHKTMLTDATCDGAYRQMVGRVMALSGLKKLQGGADPGHKPTQDDLKRIAAFGEPWQLMAAIGDSHYDAEEWSDAVRAYEAALDDLRDKAANPKPPPRDVEETIAKRAYQARALAPTYVATRRFRGKPGGLSSPEFRSFTAEVVPVPIRFAYNRAVLEQDGEAAAKDILAFLNEKKPARIRLIGHTDPKGSADYNLKLSKDRAQAVATFLTVNGFAGQVEIVGKGRSEPFLSDDPAKYSEQQRDAFDRRVEYQLIAD